MWSSGPRTHTLTCAAEATPLHYMPEDALGESPCCRGHAFNPYFPPFLVAAYMSLPLVRPLVPLPRGGGGVPCPCVRVSACVSVRPSSRVPSPSRQVMNRVVFSEYELDNERFEYSYS